MFKATFNNISVISWRSVLLVEKAGVPPENTTYQRKSQTNLSHERDSNSKRFWRNALIADVEQEWLTLLEHMRLPQVFSEVGVLVFCVIFCRSLFVLCPFFI